MRKQEVSQAVTEVIEKRKGKQLPENQEHLRAPQDLPQVGDWYVFNFGTPMGYDAEKGRKTYRVQVSMAPVLTFVTHGKDYHVTFDMERVKEFVTFFPGELFTSTEEVIVGLRALADSIERGVK